MGQAPRAAGRPSRWRAATRLRCCERCSEAVIDDAVRPEVGHGAVAHRVGERRRRGHVEDDLDPAVGGVHRLAARTRGLGELLDDLARGDHEPVGDARPRAQHEVPARVRGHVVSTSSTATWTRAATRLRHSMAGQVSITIGTPAAMVRSKAASSMTPSWNQTPLAPTATASSANWPAALRAPEDVDHVDLERHVGEGRVALLAEHGRGVGWIGHDLLAALLEQRRDPVRRTARVAGEPDDCPGRALVEHEPTASGSCQSLST